MRRGKAILLKMAGFAVTAACGLLVLACVEKTALTGVKAEPPAPPLSVKQAQDGGQPVDISGIFPRSRKAEARPGGPLAYFSGKSFVGSSRCAACHDLLVDSAGNDMSISNHWRSTMMANAARDPLWLAKVSSEISRNPALAQVIEAKCAACHMPMAWVQAGAGNRKQAIMEDGFLNRDSEFHAAAMDGVSCSLCHQIQDRKLGTKENFSGKFSLETGASSPERFIFGPYHETVKEPMQGSVGYTPVYGPQTNDSSLCATCHTLYTPFVDAAGKVAGEFPEQTPYLEWRHSDYGVSAEQRYDLGENKGQGRLCQECHMPHNKGGPVNIARWAPAATREKGHFSQHHFVGGNVFMLNILADNIANLNISASTAKLEDSKARTLAQLQGGSARLSLVDSRDSGAELTATFLIESLAGHKFPTGFPSRNLWLHVSLFDRNDQIVFESGRALSDGRIAGNNADEAAGTYEPHYEMISSPEQVQIYETIMANTDGEVTYTLLRASRYLKDNRLLPRGFDKGTAAADIAVYGTAAADVDFVGGSDRVSYRMKKNGSSGPFTLRAELLYSPVSFNFMRDLNRDETLPLVRRFGGYYEKADKTPVAIAAVQKTVE